MKIAFTTLGCKLNYAETSTYERGLLAAGWTVVPWSSEADIYLINTCAVTETAEKKSRNLIRRAHKTAPGARIVVTGCYAQLRREALMAMDGVWKVFGADEKATLVPTLLSETAASPGEGTASEIHGHPRPCKRWEGSRSDDFRGYTLPGGSVARFPNFRSILQWRRTHAEFPESAGRV